MYLRIKKAFRSSRSQMRAVDFMVSAFIFLIMLAQFVLLLFNIQVALHTTVLGDINQSDASDLYRQIFLQPGSPSWGTQPELPQAFGLALETELQYSTPSRSVVDPAKLARIGGDPSAIQYYPGIEPRFQPVTYQFIHEALGLDDNTHFQLKLLPPLNITYQQEEVSINTANTQMTFSYKVTVTHTITHEPVNNATITIIVIDFLTSKTTSFTTTTDSDGKATLQMVAPSNQGRAHEQGFGIIVIARKSNALWGITWIQDDNLTPSANLVFINGDSKNFESFLSFSMQKRSYFSSSTVSRFTKINNQSVMLFEEQQPNQFMVVTSQSLLTTNPIVLEAKASNMDGLSFLVHYARINHDNGTTTYYYRIITLPAILDKFSGTDRFHPPLAPTFIPENIQGKITIQRTVVTRGLLLIAELTYMKF